MLRYHAWNEGRLGKRLIEGSNHASNEAIHPVHPHWIVISKISASLIYMRAPCTQTSNNTQIGYSNKPYATTRRCQNTAKDLFQQAPQFRHKFSIKMLTATNARAMGSSKAATRSAGTFRAVNPTRVVQARASSRDQRDAFASSTFAAAAAALLLVSELLPGLATQPVVAAQHLSCAAAPQTSAARSFSSLCSLHSR